ncbi:hypothetical protein [Aetokthonos hydrillicola]|nr:hypothetical protein [Aetokthonos hydrillicola]
MSKVLHIKACDSLKWLLYLPPRRAGVSHNRNSPYTGTMRRN